MQGMCQDLKFEISKVPKDKDLLSTAAPEKNGGTLPKINVDLTALIRSVQRSEGNSDCFRRNKGYCDQLGCAWRSYCLPLQGDAQQDPSKSA